MGRYVTALAVILVVTAAGVAIAETGDDGTIYACAGVTGRLRLVDGPDDCRSWEEPVFWNQTGPPGADGEDGADGNLALAGQACTDEGASVVGFDETGDIICRVGGATTTTTSTLPPQYIDLSGEWMVTEVVEHGCGDVAPDPGATVSVEHDDFLRAYWTTAAGDWRFESADSVPPMIVGEVDLIGEAGFLFTPEDSPFEGEIGADLSSTPEWLYVSVSLEWGDPSCEALVEIIAER